MNGPSYNRRRQYRDRISRDMLSLSVEMTRDDLGDKITMSGPGKTVEVPFTLGPWTGIASVVSGNELKTDGYGMILVFDLELIPSEEISLAKALEAFFGAEVIE